MEKTYLSIHLPYPVIILGILSHGSELYDFCLFGTEEVIRIGA